MEPFDGAAYLERCHTRELLAMKARLYRVNGGSAIFGDRSFFCLGDNSGSYGVSLGQIKAELAKREHVPNKMEAKRQRQQQARRRRSCGKSRNR
jgi:hypothetical protein